MQYIDAIFLIFCWGRQALWVGYGLGMDWVWIGLVWVR